MIDTYNILHFCVNVNTFQKGENVKVEKSTLTSFGKEIKKRLIDLDKNHNWLINQICKQTGLYFDRSYLHKIMTGKLDTPKIVQAIREILGIPDTSQE